MNEFYILLNSIEPTKPLHQGVNSSNTSLDFFNFDLIYSAISLGLYIGTEVIQPVPIPSAPLIRIIGNIGTK